MGTWSSTACFVALTAASCGHAAPRATMAPTTCARPSWRSLTPQATIPAERGTAVGITVAKGRGNYAIDYAFVELLAPDPDFNDSFGAIYQHRGKGLLSASAQGPAADRRIAIEFTGADSNGAPLPAGKYPVVFALGVTHAGPCKAGNFGVSGILATLDWQG